MIDLGPFTWEAFTSLATGFAAVIAALIVGLKQTAISRHQTDILNLQAELEKNAQKIALYERRMEAFYTVSEFSEILKIGERPKHEEMGRFTHAAIQTYYLFDGKVVDCVHRLKDILSALIDTTEGNVVVVRGTTPDEQHAVNEIFETLLDAIKPQLSLE